MAECANCLPFLQKICLRETRESSIARSTSLAGGSDDRGESHPASRGRLDVRLRLPPGHAFRTQSLDPLVIGPSLTPPVSPGGLRLHLEAPPRRARARSWNGR